MRWLLKNCFSHVWHFILVRRNCWVFDCQSIEHTICHLHWQLYVEIKSTLSRWKAWNFFREAKTNEWCMTSLTNDVKERYLHTNYALAFPWHSLMTEFRLCPAFWINSFWQFPESGWDFFHYKERPFKFREYCCLLYIQKVKALTKGGWIARRINPGASDGKHLNEDALRLKSLSISCLS